MRSTKLSAALTAAAALLAVAAPSAGALPRRAHPQITGGHCSLSIFAEPRTITVGEAVEVSGQLNCGIANASGKTVTLYQRTPGSPLKIAGTTPTAAGGVYSFVETSVATNSTFFVRVAGKRSADRAVAVAPVVTLSGPADGSQLRTGVRHEVTFTGTVSPDDIGAKVVLQREAATANEEWHAIQYGHVLPGPGGVGVYSITHRFVFPGDANIRVVVHPQHFTFTTRGISNTLSYQISQAENPKLTINTTDDAVPYGSPVTITGILAGGANKVVTLLSHPRQVPGFTAVATAETNGAGEYKFAIAAETRNTYYQVTGEGIKSAVLFQGVRYVLTAGVSATKAVAGSPVIFSGTVLPGREGHGVYLERQNGSGNGYHVVNVGALTKTGTYSIEQYLYGSGSQVYRVRVPGDPENQAVSSAPFTIEVTPAPVPALHPVKPAILPGEGQV